MKSKSANVLVLRLKTQSRKPRSDCFTEQGERLIRESNIRVESKNGGIKTIQRIPSKETFEPASFKQTNLVTNFKHS